MLWPDEIWPQENAMLAVLDGSGLFDADGRFRLEAVQEMIRSRLHLVPRLRQLLYLPGPGLGRPLWVDAPAFDIREHVRVEPLAAPADEAALLAAAEELRRLRLDHSRPLWMMWLLPGLPGRRVGMFVKLHHVLADGMASIATMAAFLDTEPSAAGVSAPLWTPPPPWPSNRDLAADNVRAHMAAMGRAVSAVVHPLATARRVVATWPAVRELFGVRPAPATSLDRLVGPDRTMAVVRTGLAEVADIGHRYDATVNDVLLTLITGGLRNLLRTRGEDVDGGTVRCYVPISLRHSDPRVVASGNLISQMVVPLPVDTADAGLRLRRIAAETVTRKAKTRPSLGALFHGAISRRVLLKLVARQRVNVTTANLRGPASPRYLAGARLLEAFPVLPLIANVSLGVGALSYAGRFAITVTADRDAYPDLAAFTAGVRGDLRALCAGPLGTGARLDDGADDQQRRHGDELSAEDHLVDVDGGSPADGTLLEDVHT